MERLAGRYELDVEMARGRGRTLWRGRDVVLDRPVGVLLLEEGHPHAAAVRRAAQRAAGVEHPGLLRVIDTAEDEGRVFVVTRWMAGSPLSEQLAIAPLDPAAGSRGRHRRRRCPCRRGARRRSPSRARPPRRPHHRPRGGSRRHRSPSGARRGGRRRRCRAGGCVADRCPALRLAHGQVAGPPLRRTDERAGRRRSGRPTSPSACRSPRRPRRHRLAGAQP